MLRESAQGFLAREATTKRLRRLRAEHKDFDRTLWRALAEMGWTGAWVPEQYGGLGLGLSEMAAVADLCGAHLLPEPVVPVAGLAVRVLAAVDNEALKQRLLGAIAAGDLIAAVAWQGEDPHVADPGWSMVTARINGSGVVLTGNARFVRPGMDCDGYIVSATGPGAGLYWAPADSIGLSLTPELTADGGMQGRLVFGNVRVAADHALATGKNAIALLARALDEALILTGAELVGLTRRALEITVEYLKTRKQFGRPIGSFQALQHRAVDLLIQKELGAAALNEAVTAAESASAEELSILASRVKSRCADAALLVTREAIQLHGAIGFTDECDIGLYLKRALMLSAWLGNGAFHRRRYARLTMARSVP